MTTTAIARALRPFHNLTIVTNAVNIAADLSGTAVEVILTGGTLRKNSFSLVGPIAEEDLYHGILWGLITAIKGGQTGTVDMYYGRPSLPDFGCEPALRAYQDAGLRTAFGRRLPLEFRMDAAFCQRAVFRLLATRGCAYAIKVGYWQLVDQELRERVRQAATIDLSQRIGNMKTAMSGQHQSGALATDLLIGRQEAGQVYSTHDALVADILLQGTASAAGRLVTRPDDASRRAAVDGRRDGARVRHPRGGRHVRRALDARRRRAARGRGAHLRRSPSRP